MQDIYFKAEKDIIYASGETTACQQIREKQEKGINIMYSHILNEAVTDLPFCYYGLSSAVTVLVDWDPAALRSLHSISYSNTHQKDLPHYIHWCWHHCDYWYPKSIISRIGLSRSI